MIEFYPVNTSPFSKKIKIKLRLWNLINITIFRYSFFFMRKWRIFLIKIFGGNIDWSCSIDRKTNIDAPWLLSMGANSSLGENAWLQCYAQITIGKKCCIGKNVCIVTGSHSIFSPKFELNVSPIKINDNVWIATNAFIHKGTEIGEGAVVAACAVVSGKIEPWTVVGGNPAVVIKKRVLKDE